MSENLFRKIWCRKIYFGKFSVGKLSRKIRCRKMCCRKNLRIPLQKKQMKSIANVKFLQRHCVIMKQLYVKYFFKCYLINLTLMWSCLSWNQIPTSHLKTFRNFFLSYGSWSVVLNMGSVPYPSYVLGIHNIKYLCYIIADNWKPHQSWNTYDTHIFHLKILIFIPKT